MSQPVTTVDTWLKENAALRMDATSELFPLRSRTIHVQRYEFAKAYCQCKRVLDGACGVGYGSAILAEAAEYVNGIDISEKAIDYANSKYGAKKVTFDRSLVEFTKFDAKSFDTVVSFETVEHTLCPKSHIREITRLLKPSGTAVLSVPNGWGLTDHHFFDFDLHLLQGILTPAFREIEYWSQIAADSEGKGGKIVPLKKGAIENAYCIIAVCKKPLPRGADADIFEIMREVYASAFKRHNEYLTLAYRANSSIVKRAANKMKSYLKNDR